MRRLPNLPSARRCCGCSACHDICPRSAIRMVPDREGFLHPEVDHDACVGCGSCSAVCPVLHPGFVREPISVRAVRANDDGLRLASSSGGVFSLLARETIRSGGLVFGAAFDSTDGEIRHVCASDEEDLAALRGSKYVQSDISGAYAKVRDATRSGVQVLFSGTPCQIAALLRFPGIDRKRLLSVEVICMGVSSPEVWRRYLSSRISGRSLRDLSVSFRDKDMGWKRFSLSLADKGVVFYRQPLSSDPYLRGMLARLFLRRNCSHCSFRRLRSGADITLGDYWNVHRRFPSMDDNRGTSVVLSNSIAGETAVRSILPLCSVAESDWRDAVAVNPALVRSKPHHSRRGLFFILAKGNAFPDLVARLTRPSPWRRIARLAKGVLRRRTGRRKGSCP